MFTDLSSHKQVFDYLDVEIMETDYVMIREYIGVWRRADATARVSGAWPTAPG
jgi:hypothetical protein